eukprot:602347_1
MPVSELVKIKMHSHNMLVTFMFILLSILAGSVSAFTWCSFASQCIGNTIVDSSSTVYAKGYKSIFGPTTSITSTNSVVRCQAAVSCSKLSFLSILTGGDIFIVEVLCRVMISPQFNIHTLFHLEHPDISIALEPIRVNRSHSLDHPFLVLIQSHNAAGLIAAPIRSLLKQKKSSVLELIPCTIP